MKIKIYVDYENCEVLTEEQYKKALIERAKSYKADDKAFEEWLNNKYTSFEIFKMPSYELDKVMEKWEGLCEADAEDDMSMELTEYELDV